VKIRPREVVDQAAARAFLARHGSLRVARLGELVHPLDHPALVAETGGGQLLGMLIKGDARLRMRLPEIRRLGCTDHLKEIVYRCIGERRKRYESADEMIEALRNPPAALKAGVLRTLKGVHVAFTGILTRKRSEAIRAAKRAGAIVHSGPSAKTTVVVRGRPNPLQAAGKDAGIKLMEIKRLREKGHRITLLDERRFWRLAGAKR